jgi:hypothetical protein
MVAAGTHTQIVDFSEMAGKRECGTKTVRAELRLCANGFSIAVFSHIVDRESLQGRTQFQQFLGISHVMLVGEI